jgi:hypothetical protein
MPCLGGTFDPCLSLRGGYDRPEPNRRVAPQSGRVMSGCQLGVSTKAPSAAPSAPELFAVLWETMADILGTAATAEYCGVPPSAALCETLGCMA